MAGGYRTPRNGEMGRILGENADLRRRVKELEKPGQAEKSSIRRSVVGATLPGGSYRGAVLAANEDGKPVWSTPMGAIIPKYWITLDAEGSSYEVARFGPQTTQEAAKKMLPAPLFEYNWGLNNDITQMDWPISWGNESFIWGSHPLMSDPMPISMEIYVHPRFEGQRFEVSLPASWMGSGGAAWYIVVVYNETAYTADLELSTDSMIYDGGITRPWRLDLAPDEYFAWKVDNQYFDHVARIQPFWQHMGFGGGVSAGVPLDNWYWKNVRALEQEQSFSQSGDAVAVNGTHRFYNGRNQTVRVGKLIASVGGGPPVGSGIQIQAMLNGVTPLFATPLTIPAGEHFVEGIPDLGGTDMSTNWALPAGDVVVLLWPGDFVRIDVLDVGSSSAGSGLTVQLFYG